MRHTTTTPLMRQYEQMKEKYPGSLLLFRVGDFYETFEEDAVKASKILDIVLTKRANGSASAVQLAGFPHHALDNYLPKLVKAGLRVAVCDQLEDPKMAKGLVKRGVTELVTPGLSFHDAVLDRKQNNYLASLYFEKDTIGIAFLDVSTGEFLTAQGDQLHIEKLMQSFQPAEVILSKKQQAHFQSLLQADYPSYALEEWVYQLDYATEMLNEHFGTASIKGFGIEKLSLGIIASGAILRYLEETEHNNKQHITSLARIEEEQYVWLDKFTIKNLEILAPQQEGGISLLEVLDQTVTPMGARLLKKWLVLPLKDMQSIQKRLEMVELLITEPLLEQSILHELKQISDLERLTAKVSVGRAAPKDLLALQKALHHTTLVQHHLANHHHELCLQFAKQLYDCSFLAEKIQQTLQDKPPLSITQGNLIREGVDSELDELRKLAYSGKDYLLKLQQKEIRQTEISSLKIAYNKVFGYYLEVTNAQKAKVPSHWIRKQTLVNAERYVTEELKVYEDKILQAEVKMAEIEARLYQELSASAIEFVPHILQNAKIIAQLDCYTTFASKARKYDYTKPLIMDHNQLTIEAGRHPVIEQQLPLCENYIPNDVYLDNESQQIMIITGPNMAGKSALLRQVALIVIMAQVGSFVPAAKAEIGIVDKIFTRVGASDNLALGESTFMVEMTETASIMHNLSARSLVIMDEIGRGTSTYDGISIAWAIVEYLHSCTKHCPKTLFATHYHELNQLADKLERVKNFHVTVKEVVGKIIFLRKLMPGGSEHSFGIHVAQLAGMPKQIVERANDMLAYLENREDHTSIKNKIKTVPADKTYQLSLFDPNPNIAKAHKIITGLQINTLSPIEALLKLREIKDLME